jgi:predicted aspartyl protease
LGKRHKEKGLSQLRPARRGVLLGGLSLMLGGPALAQQTGARLGAAPVDPNSSLDAWVDVYGRPTAKVMLNGRGPYQFLVDTGSNITVVASRIAAELGAPAAGMAMVNGTTGSADMAVALLDKLETGVVRAADLRIAVLPDEALPRQDGILGADVFAGRRLVFNIQARRVSVELPSAVSHVNEHAASSSNMRVRSGRLAEVDGRIGRVRLLMMLDTGADNCIINSALDAALKQTFPHLTRIDQAKVLGVTGQTLTGDLLLLPDVNFGGVTLKGASGVATDAPIFKVWGLTQQPAMIVGVSVLSRLASFSIDYGAQVFQATPLALLAGQRVQLG